jgi:hypothetical protein
MSDPVILFIATAGAQDISIARREPDGTLRRAEYANINWLDRLSRDNPAVVTLNPAADLHHFHTRMVENFARTNEFSGVLDLSYHVSGYFTALKRYYGSDWSGDIAGVGLDIRELSEAVGVPVQSYDPDKNSTNRLNWTLRLWERTKD